MGKEFEKKKVTYICTTESLCCTPETKYNIVNQLYVSEKSLSSVWLFATPWTVAHQAPPSMGFSRQEYWSGLPFSSPRDLPDPGIEPRFPALQAEALTSEPPGEPQIFLWAPFLGGWGVARILEWLAVPFSRRSFSTQGLNPGLPHCRQTLYCLNHQGSQ